MKTMSSKNLPALSENRLLRYFSFAMLYVAQGIPEGIMLFAIPAWLAVHGKTAAEISGYSAIIFLPFSLKIIAAPLVERFTFLAMGRRRPWIIFGQLGIFASLIVMASVSDPLNNLVVLIAVGFCVFVFVTVQDIATDALAIDIVPIQEQAKANGMMWGAKVVGTAASLATSTWLLNTYGFFTALFSLSLFVAFIMLVPLLLRERPDEKLLPWTTGRVSPDAAAMHLDSFKKIFKSLLRVLKLPNSLLLMVVTFIILIALGFMRTLFPIFTIQALGWSNQDYSSVYATTSLAGGILGMLAGGFLVDRFGSIRMISIYLILLILFTTILAFSQNWWSQRYFINGYITAFNFLYTFIIIAMFAMIMQCCWKRISALQFTLSMAIFNLGQTAGSALIGPLRNYFSWNYTILSFSGVAIVALVIIQIINLKKHLKQIEDLENITITPGVLAA
jgi:PAT family beta-lactamase induction signal transducer AmpG